MNDCHMSCGLKNVWRTSALPGASRNTATSAPITTSVLAVEMAVARRPPPVSSRGPRPVVPNEPGAGEPLSPDGGPPGASPGPDPNGSGLDGRDAQVDLQVLLLQLLQGAVALQGGQRLVDAADERVALGEQQPEV